MLHVVKACVRYCYIRNIFMKEDCQKKNKLKSRLYKFFISNPVPFNGQDYTKKETWN